MKDRGVASSTETAATGEAQRFYSREVAGKGPTLSVTATCRAGFVEADGGCTAGRQRRRGRGRTAGAPIAERAQEPVIRVGMLVQARRFGTARGRGAPGRRAHRWAVCGGAPVEGA